MPSRLAPLLLVAVLLLGQLGGWLHEMSHHAGVDRQTLVSDVGGAGKFDDQDGPVDRRCLVCLGIAALTLALPAGLLALALLAARFARPTFADQLAVACRRFAHQARAPPVLS